MSLEKLNVSVKELSALLGLDDRRVQQLADEGVVTRTERGRYALAESVSGYVAFLRKQVPNSGKPEESFRIEQARLVRAKAEMAEMEAAKQRGELGSVAEMQKTVEGLARSTMEKLRVIPSRLSAQLAATKDEIRCEEMLTEEITQALEQILELADQPATDAEEAAA